MATETGILEGEGIDEYNNVLLEVIEEDWDTDDAFKVIDNLGLEDLQVRYLEQTVNKIHTKHKKELAELQKSLNHAVSKL